MNENEKRILTILNQSGPMNRKDIAAACGISWAGTVKLVSRLEEKGLLRCLGESETKTENGKTSLVYAVAETRPLAIGIDVEYSRTRAAVYNLRREVFYRDSVPTETGGDAAGLVAHLAAVVARCKAALVEKKLEVEGVGIGLPSWLLPSKKPWFDQVARSLSEACGLPVVADNNTRAYTLYLQRKFSIGGSFAVFIVRKGLGIGIAIKGELYRGEDGLAGELGHLVYDPEGRPCRCGKRGCVETLFNQSTLAAEWLARRDGNRLAGAALEAEAEQAAVEELFSRAVSGDAVARSVLADLGKYLVLPVSALSMSVDVRRVILAGHFGPDGSPLVKLVEDGLKHALHPRFRHQVSYERLEDEGFLIGASMLFLSGYCDYRVFGE